MIPGQLELPSGLQAVLISTTSSTRFRFVFVTRIRRVLPAMRRWNRAIVKLSVNILIQPVLYHGHESKHRRGIAARQGGGVRETYRFISSTLFPAGV
jgi:hypothetical protein